MEKLRKYLGFALGPIAAAALGLVTVPLAAWIFSPADIGRLNVWQIALSFALLLSVLGLDQAYVREYHESTNRPQLLRACFLPGFLLLSFLGFVSVFFSAPLAQWLYDDANPWWFWATLMGVLLAYVARFLSLILRMQERGLAYSTSQVLPKILLLLLMLAIAFATFTKTFSHLILITLAASLLVVAVYAWNTKSDWLAAITSAKIAPLELRKLLAFGSPLVVSGLAYWGLSATSTIVLRTWSSLDELAVYSVANSFAGAAVVLQAIFSIVWAPTVYKWNAQGVDMRVVDKIAKQMLAAVCALFAVCAGLAWVLDYVLPSHYVGVKSLLLCMLIQPLLYTLSEVTGVGIGLERRTNLMIGVTVLALSVNVGLNYTLVPHMGATGAAISNAIAFTVFFIAKTEASAQVWRNFPRAYLYLSALTLTGAAALAAL